jgi:crotonobetainyl-CoA:carnitine CoA-transferase CaiB-like acyl-CoA transferase
MRFASARGPVVDAWWEWSSVYLGCNLNKLGITLDMTTPEGLELGLELLSKADALVENFSPRVLDHFGLTWDAVRTVNPRLVMLRMPAFGLNGPWRDRTGFAQTMEQASGMAWLTGFEDGPPIIPRGPCDPLAGSHATFALLACLQERERSGRGHFVESTMVESALNVAAEMVVEYGAYGAKLERAGNRGPVAAPQGVYRCAGRENWLALAVATDAQWEGLQAVLGHPQWSADLRLQHAAGRREFHDLIDRHLNEFFGTRVLETIGDELLAAGVPAAPVVDPPRMTDNPQVRARRFAETFEHPIVGRHEVLGMPFRFSSHPGQWFRSPSPTLGQHNRHVLQGILGISDDRFDELARSGVIGDRPVGT